MIEITLPLVLQIIQTVSLVVGIIYYITIMRNQQKNQQLTLETRQATLMMNIFKELSTEKRWEEYVTALYQTEFESYEEFHQKYGRNNPKEYSKLLSLWWTYSVIGIFLEQGLLEDKQVSKLMGTLIESQWEKWGETIKGIRKDTNAPDALKDFELLYNRMKAIQASDPKEKMQ
jgi:hypothetical protein